MKQLTYKNWINIILLFILLAAMVYVSVEYAPQITEMVNNPDRLRTVLLSYGAYSTIVFILLQLTQVLIAIIPGQVVEVAGGYIYGTFTGSIYSVLGILLGTIIAFYLARWLGHPLLKIVVSEKSMEKFQFLVDSPRTELLVLILFLIPGIPKDYLAYIAGLTPIKPLSFIAISIAARFPGIVFASYLGSNLQANNTAVVILLLIIAVIIISVCIIYRDRILNHLEKC